MVGSREIDYGALSAHGRRAARGLNGSTTILTAYDRRRVALSDLTEAYDRGRKSAYYRACPAVEEYVLIATEYQAVEVYRRTTEGWSSFQAYGPGDIVELTSIGVRFPVAALYRRTSVAALDTPLERVTYSP